MKLDDKTLKLIKITQDKDLAVAALGNKLEGYNTCIRCLLERINSNIVENQISGAGSNFDAYEIRLDKWVRRIDVLESNSNQYLNK